MKMPELPPRAFQTTKGGEWIDAYTADELRAYGELVREECAKLCEQSGAGYDNEWNRKLGVADDLKEVCEECAIAIRSGA
jgi:hypothetical protein